MMNQHNHNQYNHYEHNQHNHHNHHRTTTTTIRAVTCDYATERSLCMPVKIGDILFIGSATDYEGYIFVVDTFKHKSGYISVSVVLA